MSLPRKEVRAFIEPDMHEKLAIIAEHKDAQIAELAARLLEKAIAAEWHEVSILLDRSTRLGKRWRAAESNGDGGGKA